MINYDDIAETIAAARLESVTRRAAVIRRELRVLDEMRGARGGDLVDLGSGTGDALLEASRDASFTSITCVDKSTAMLRKGRALVAKSGIRANYVQGSIESVGLPPNCCDIALLNSVVQHIEDLTVAFASVRNLLRPGGALGIYTLSHSQLRKHHLVRFFPRVAELNVSRYPTVDELLELLNGARFEHTRVEAMESVVSSDSRGYAKSIINKYASVLHLLTPQEYEAGIQRLQATMREAGDEFRFEARYTIIGAV